MGSSTLGKAASLDALLNECIHAFDDNGELQASLLPRSLLLMHRWYWIVTFPAEFNLDLGLIRITEEFRDVAAQLGCEEHFKLIDISTIPSYDWMRKLTQRKKQAKKGKASLLFDHLEPMELAEHLTFLEFKSIRRISFTDYHSYVIHGCLVENPTLERSIALFNGVSQWVQLMVLSKLTPQTRAEVITKYIHVAQKLLQLQNFNTLMAVVGGLSHSSISRLKETHSYLAAEVVRIWSEMTELVSSNNNYSCYRKAFNECQGFKIPILGVHLKDLIAVHVVFPDWVDDSNKVNLVKMQQLYMTFNELVSLQSAVAQVEPNMDLIYLLTPTSPTTPNKPLAPLDWASGVTTKPDPSVVNKHIRKVVDLWGIIKQGYKCKDCGVNCHKQCRELLVLACRKLLRSSSLGSVSPARLTHSSLPSSPALPVCKDEDEVFEFPAVTPAGPALDTQSITLMTGSAQRISVRLQRATTSQATQTEPLWPEHSWGTTDGGSHTFPKMKYRTHRKTSKNKGFARWENQNDGQRQALSSRCSTDSQEKSGISGELVQNGITHRGKNS
eukprot:superscaffoldBa00000997_g8431